MTVMAHGMTISGVERDVFKARDDGRRPRLHQNGFIQLDLAPPTDATRGHSGASRRLHVFPWPKIETQKTPSPIHDHVFDMRSDVLLGTIFQQVYTADLDHGGDPTHEVCIPRYEAASESTLQQTGVLVSAIYSQIDTYGAGDHYTQYATSFHETDWKELSMTVMTKEMVYGELDCRVLVPVGQKPDNDFKRNSYPEAALWNIINGALRAAKEQA